MNWRQATAVFCFAASILGTMPSRSWAADTLAGDIEDPATWKPAQAELCKLGDGFLVWESRRTGTWQIWTENLDGTGLKQLTPAQPNRNQMCPHISPDGTRVAYLDTHVDEVNPSTETPDGPAGPSPLHLINRDGTGDHIIVPAAGRYGRWDRAVVWFNNNELAYIGSDGHTYRLDLASGKSTLLFKSQHGMNWLPNVKLDHVVEAFNQVSRLDKDKQVITLLPGLGGCQPYPTADGNWVVWNHYCGGPLGKANLGTGEVSDFDLHMPGGYDFIYFSMVSDNMHLLAFCGRLKEHAVGGYAGGEESWYEVFVAPLDPKTLEVTGKPVRYTFGSKKTNRFPDVWQATPALGFQSDKAPFTASFATKDMSGDWAWDFGDGSKETAAAGKHLYAKPGVYVVSATQSDRVLRGQAIVKEPTPPKIQGTLVENVKEIVVSFSEPMNLEKAKFRLASGAPIERTEIGKEGRNARLFLAKRLLKDDTLQVEGATDVAQKPNPLTGTTVAVRASFWPDNPARAAFIWETGDKPNLVRDPFTGEIHSFTLEWRNRAWMDHNYALVCNGGMCNVLGIRDVWFNDVRQSDHPGQVSFECTITPRDLENDHQEISTFGLMQRKNHLYFSGRDFGALEAGKPYHVVITSGNGELCGYLNGKEVLNTKASWTFEGFLTFGAGLDNRPWIGTIEGIALYNRVLSADEVSAACAAYAKLRANRKPVPSVQVEAEVTACSKVFTPKEIAPYTRGMALFEYKVSKVLSGTLDAKKIRVAHWTVLDRDATRASTLPVGAVMQLTLERMEDNPQLDGDQIDDTLPIDDTPRFFAVQEKRVGPTGVPAWKMIPADMDKTEPIETMPDIAGSFKLPEGQTWKVGTPDPVLDLLNPGLFGCPGTVYALAYVTSPKDQQGQISLYTSSTAKVWINGQLVTTVNNDDIVRYPFAGNRRVKIALKKGVNQLLVKVTNFCGRYALACDLMNAQGQEMTDVTYSLDPK